ncbi:MAG: class I SAM-dependent methyltransferase [Spirochaetota bacterium]
MKNYQDVVRDRYDNPESKAVPDIWALLGRIGHYSEGKIRDLLWRSVNIARSGGLDLGKATILDIGCGSGFWTRVMAEYKGSPEDIYGVDLSSLRIAQAKKMNGFISYELCDIVEGIPSFGVTFDMVLLFDVLMHLRSQGQIDKAMANIGRLLNKDGWLLVYDAWAPDHFTSSSGSDWQGFSERQLLDAVKSAGMRIVTKENVFKYLWKNRHSALVAHSRPRMFVEIAERLYPGNPGNIAVLARKSGSGV